MARMRFEIFTLFPGMFAGVFEDSILHRARDAGLIEIGLHNIREHTHDRHHITDDYAYGGGGGMVMKPEPIYEAVESVLGAETAERPPVLLLTPQGRVFDSALARELAQSPRLALVCGHYEGVDERVRALATMELSIGDYVLTGGEIAAMVVVDAVARFVPGVVGDPGAPHDDSHATGLLEYPQYTRPPEFRGMSVPEVLLSGHHGRIERWRREQALARTLAQRPDLLSKAALSEQDRAYLRGLGWEERDEG